MIYCYLSSWSFGSLGGKAERAQASKVFQSTSGPLEITKLSQT